MKILSTMFISMLTANVFAQDVSCPWKISSIEAGKWGNGNIKSRIWVNGSFPIPPGVSERPTWFANGRNVGYSPIFLGQRILPNSAGLLKPGNNTIMVQFFKLPYHGVSSQKNISDFNWDKVPKGGRKRFQ